MEKDPEEEDEHVYLAISNRSTLETLNIRQIPDNICCLTLFTTENALEKNQNGSVNLPENMKIIDLKDYTVYIGSEEEFSKLNSGEINTARNGEENLNIEIDEFPNHKNEDEEENGVEEGSEECRNTSKGKRKQFVCSYENCGKIYTKLYHLNVHMRSHSNTKPFSCTYCACCFQTNYTLTAHIRTHTGERPFSCELCQKAFKTSGDRQKHRRTHTGERPFLCTFDGCPKRFTTSTIRKMHMRTHTGERPFLCAHNGCGKAFASVTNFNNHQRIHTGERPFLCDFENCGKRFTEHSSLYKHKNFVHKAQ